MEAMCSSAELRAVQAHTRLDYIYLKVVLQHNITVYGGVMVLSVNTLHLA